MESSENRYKSLAVGSMVVAVVSLVVALFGALKAPEPKGPDSLGAEMQGQLAALNERVSHLESAPKPAANLGGKDVAKTDAAKIRIDMMDTALKDQETLLAELQARVKTLEGAPKVAVAPAAPVRPPAPPVAASPVQAESKVLRAERVEIVDAAGNVRGVIAAGEDGVAGLTLLDKNGQPRSEYSLTGNGSPRLIFTEKDGKRYSLLPVVTEVR
jgi:hypothetical protein